MTIPINHLNQIFEQLINGKYYDEEFVVRSEDVILRILTFACYNSEDFNTPPAAYYQASIKITDFNLEDIVDILYEVKPKVILKTLWVKV